jgi:hypothetical protein
MKTAITASYFTAWHQRNTIVGNMGETALVPLPPAGPFDAVEEDRVAAIRAGVRRDVGPIARQTPQLAQQ